MGEETVGRGVEGEWGRRGGGGGYLIRYQFVSDKDDLTQYIISLVSPVLRDCFFVFCLFCFC